MVEALTFLTLDPCLLILSSDTGEGAIINPFPET
jgi:hypothetical protein